MQIQVLSDLHLEFEPEELPALSSLADVLVYAGDIGTKPGQVYDYFKEVRKTTKAPIVYVMGNHEFYGKYLYSVSEYKQVLKEIPDLHVLDKDSLILDGIRFVGCTLWTNFDDRKGEIAAQLGLADFNNIKKIGKYYEISNITTQDIILEYRECRDFLQKELCRVSYEGPTVVITHHGPSFYCVPEEYKGNQLNGCFYVEVSDLILAGRPVLWVYGHSHTMNRLYIGKTELICNPWGYPFESYKSASPVIVEVPDGKKAKTD